MQVRVTKLRVGLAAGVLVLAGAGLAGALSPLVGNAYAAVQQIVGIADAVNGNNAKVDSAGALKTSVANPTTSPIPVRTFAPSKPFQKNVSVQVSQGSPEGAATFTVPSLQRLTIENFSARVAVPAGTGQRSTLQITANGIRYYPVLEFQGTFGPHTIYQVNMPLHGYADADSTVELRLARSDYSTGYSWVVSSFSGFLSPM